MKKHNQSTKKFLRSQKSKIRKECLDKQKQQELIEKLYEKVSQNHENK